MALSAQNLAKVLKATLNFPGASAALPPTGELNNYAAGVIASLQSAVVTNAPGTIMGVTAASSPLSAGTGLGGVVVMSPGPMIAKTTSSFPGATFIIQENTAVITYLSTGLANFAAGTITGHCTNTAISPGPLTNGAGSGGLIIGINGPACLAAVKAVFPTIGPESLPFYTALTTYIMANASISYPMGNVIGVCPAGGGPLSAGSAAGGKIS